MDKSRGFFVVAINSDNCDYCRLAYGLALSIKATQIKYDNISVAVRSVTDIHEEWRHVFDEIIEIPFSDNIKASKIKDISKTMMTSDEFTEYCKWIDGKYKLDPFNGNPWRFGQESKVYDLSPYDETIKLEADMLLFSDISHWWDVFSLRDLQIANKVVDYRGITAETDYYRQCFINNDLYSAHSCMTYFKKSRIAKQFFDTVGDIFDNWEDISWQMIRKNHQDEPTTDVVYGLAVELLGYNNYVAPVNDDLTFVHMRTFAMPWQSRFSANDNWTEVSEYGFTPSLSLYVNNFKQENPFHYHVKDFLTDEIIKMYEDFLK